jgi:hypothetical protein
MKLATTSVAVGAALAGAMTFAAACVSHPDRAEGGGPGLFFHETDGTATLAWGEPNSDAMGLMMQCAAGSGAINVSDVVRSPSADRLILVAGKVRSDLPGSLDMSTGQPTLYATADADDQALEAFRRTGRIAVKSRGGAYALEAEADERDGIERFFRACSRA